MTTSFDTVFRLGDGNDLNTGNGSDLVIAGGGDDTIGGGGGADKINGQDGDDVIRGGTGPDKLSGGANDDEIFGGAGSDRIYGGSGDDTIIGGSGDDVLYGDIAGDRNAGATGADTFQFNHDSGTDKVFDFVSGVDQVVLDGDTSQGYTLFYKNGNTVMDYGDSKVIFYDEFVTAVDISGSFEII